MAKKITETAIAFIQLIPSIKSAKDLMDLLNMTFKTNTIGLVVAAIGALTTAFVAFGLSTNDVDKEIERSNKVLKEYDDTMKEISKRKAHGASEPRKPGHAPHAAHLHLALHRGRIRPGGEHHALYRRHAAREAAL